MRILSEKRSLHSFWRDLVFLEAALLADDETKHLAAPITEVLDMLPMLEQRDRDTQRSLIQARARATLADAHLDERIRKVHSNTLYLVEQDKKSKPFSRLFPSSLSRTIRHALEKQVTLAKEMMQVLRLDLYQDTFRQEQSGLLEPVVEHGQTMLTERRDAENTRSAGRYDMEAWKEEANAVRTSVYAELMVIAANTSRKKAWANLFFVKATSRRKASDEDNNEDDEDGH